MGDAQWHSCVSAPGGLKIEFVGPPCQPLKSCGWIVIPSGQLPFGASCLEPFAVSMLHIFVPSAYALSLMGFAQQAAGARGLRSLAFVMHHHLRSKSVRPYGARS